MKPTLLFLLVSLTALSQELPRRAFLGIRMTKVNDDTKRLLNLAEEKGVLLEEVIAGSTAEKAGFKKGDVLLSINDKEVNSPAETVSAVSGLNVDSKFTYTIIRNGKTVKGNSSISAMPYEKHDGVEMVYTAVQTVNGLQRLIISKPPGDSKKPVVFFVGGIGCYSLDFPFEPDRSEVQLLNSLTKAGYVCVRAEKPGVGDNRECTPCEKVTFLNEVAGYVEGIRKVKQLSFADSSQVFIVGHSMGGVMAPLVARSAAVKGIVAYGTIGSNFIEYLAKTRRTIAAAYEMPPDETDTYIKDYCECAVWYLADQMTTADAARKNPDCREYLSVFDLRSRSYMNELYRLNIPGSWKHFNGKALMLYGEMDFIASEEDHRVIAKSLDFYRPGHASFRKVENATHGMTRASSYTDARQNDGVYNPAVGAAIIDWLKTAG